MRVSIRTASFACLLGLFVLLPATPAQPPAGDVVAGTVVDARTGRPLAHAVVTLSALSDNHTEARTVASGEGSFRFPKAVPPGKFRLVGQAAGHLPTAYLQHGELSTALVTGAGLPTQALQLALIPEAEISGRVLDESGEPVPHASVLLFEQQKDGGLEGASAIRNAGTQTVDDLGNYAFERLMPGRYFVAARGVPWYAVHPPPTRPEVPQPYRTAVDPALDVAYPMVFYPAATSSEAASPLDLIGGDRVAANLQLVPQPAVSLTVRFSGEPGTGPQTQLVQSPFGTEQPVFTQNEFGASAEVLQGLAPGRYSLREFGGNRIPVAGGSVDLTSGSVVQDAAPRPALATVTLHVRSATGTPLPANSQVLLRSGEPERRTTGAVNEAGDVVFQDVPPGDYRVNGVGEYGLLSPAALEVNGRPVTDRRLHLAGGGAVTGRLAVDGRPVQLEGFARRAGKPAPACLILLGPAGGDTDPELFRRDQSDLDGSFLLPNVAPGKYLLVALADAWALRLTDLHALAPYLLHAQPVVVPSAAGRDKIHLPEALSPQPVR